MAEPGLSDLSLSDEYGNHKCSVCANKRGAKSFCLQCEKYFCARCKRSNHDINANNKYHQILKGNDIPGEITLVTLKTRRIVFCFEHPSRIIQTVCQKHDDFCCDICEKEKHFQCALEPVDDSDFDLAKTKLEGLKESLLSTTKQMEEKEKLLKAKQESMQRQEIAITKQVEERASEMVSMINVLKEKMLSQVRETFQERISANNEQLSLCSNNTNFTNGPDDEQNESTVEFRVNNDLLDTIQTSSVIGELVWP